METDDDRGTHDKPASLTSAEVGARIGVSSSTLRTWERRYGLRLGARSGQAGWRRYGPEDVAMLRQVVRLTQAGIQPRLAIQLASTTSGAQDHVAPAIVDVRDGVALDEDRWLRAIGLHLTSPQAMTYAVVLGNAVVRWASPSVQRRAPHDPVWPVGTALLSTVDDVSAGDVRSLLTHGDAAAPVVANVRSVDGTFRPLALEAVRMDAVARRASDIVLVARGG